MTSSNRNIVCVTGRLWRESGGFPSQRPVTLDFDVCFDEPLNSWANSRVSGHLIRHCAHCNVTEMFCRGGGGGGGGGITCYKGNAEWREIYIHWCYSLTNINSALIWAYRNNWRRWLYNASAMRLCDVTITSKNRPPSLATGAKWAIHVCFDRVSAGSKCK